MIPTPYLKLCMGLPREERSVLAGAMLCGKRSPSVLYVCPRALYMAMIERICWEHANVRGCVRGARAGGDGFMWFGVAPICAYLYAGVGSAGNKVVQMGCCPAAPPAAFLPSHHSKP